MYNVFDAFLDRETWNTGHDNDNDAFYRCLSNVVSLPDFSPEKMGDHFRAVKRVDSHEHPFDLRIRDLVSKAWTVRDYLAVSR